MTTPPTHLAGPIPFRRLAELISRFGFAARLQRLAASDPDTPWTGPSGPDRLAPVHALIYSPVSPAAADGSVSAVQARGLVLLAATDGAPQRGDRLVLDDSVWQVTASLTLTGGTDRLICQLALSRPETL